MYKQCPKCHSNTFEVDTCMDRACNHFEPGGGIFADERPAMILTPKYSSGVISHPERKWFPVTDKKLEHCPDCLTSLEHEGGCNICRDCGWSACM